MRLGKAALVAAVVVVSVVGWGALGLLAYDGYQRWTWVQDERKAVEHVRRKNVRREGETTVIKMAGRELTFPTRYLSGVGHSQWGSVRVVSMEVLLPDFEPLTSAKSGEISRKVLGPGRRMRIDIRHSPSSRTVERLLEYYGEWDPYMKGRVGRPDERIYGLDYYRNTSESRSLFVPPGEPTVLIACFEYGHTLPSPACDMTIRTQSGLAVSASFSIRYLPQWREILAGLKILMAGGDPSREIVQIDGNENRQSNQ